MQEAGVIVSCKVANSLCWSTETKAASGTSQGKSETSDNLSSSGILVRRGRSEQ